MNKELPEGWKLEKLSNILSKYESGSRPKGGVQKIKEGVPSIGGEHLTPDGNFDFSKIKYIPHDFFKSMNAGIINRGDILIVKDGATTGKVSIVRNDFPYEVASINEHVFLCRTFSEINNYYLFYYLFSSKGQYYVKMNFKGTAQGGINLSFFENTFVPISPFAEQQRIVNKIEELFTNLDKGIEYLKTAQVELKLTRQSVLKYALEGKLTEDWREEHKGEIEPASVLLEKIKDERKKEGKYKDLPSIDTSELPILPPEWTWARLGDIISPSDKKCNPPFHNITNYIGLERIEKGTGKLLQINGFEELKSTKNIFHKGDLLYGKLRPYLNKVHVSNFEGICSTDILVFERNNYVPNYLLLYVLLDNKFVRYANQNVTGVHHPRVGYSAISKYVFRLPPLEEQYKIVEDIETYYSILDNMENAITQSLDQTSKIRQSILKKAFEGRLVPQNPNDEPASILLQRIKAEKNSNIKKENYQQLRID